jgi:hypothetical protein
MGVARHSGPRTSQEDAGGTEVTAPRRWQTAWHRVLPPPEAVPDQHHQLNRQLAVLEGAQDELESGWVQGRWWEVTAGGHPGHVDGACLVGALIRAGSGRNSKNSENSENSKNSESGENSATGRAVDAVYDALWASRGQPAPTTHLVPSPQVRLARVRMLTQWNDSPERTKSEVMTVIDRAISATILALMATPRPAAPSR